MKFLQFIPIVFGVLLLKIGPTSAQSTSMRTAEAELDEILFPTHNPNPNFHTDGVIVLANDQVVYEKYGNGYGPKSKHLSWSVAKASAGILTGIAADQGLVDLHAPVSNYLPESHSQATLLDFLHMSSNLDFTEEYGGIPVTADVVQMLYLDGPKQGFASYTLSRPQRNGYVPGEQFYYSSGDTNVLMATLRAALGSRYSSFPWDAYFSKLGIEDATFEQDHSGNFVGSSYLYLSLRDFARIGQLFAHRGQVMGPNGPERLISETYWKLMTTVAPGVDHPAEGADLHSAYTSQMKVNAPIPARGLGSEYPELPEDAMYVFGHQGQLIVALPTQNIVIVRLGTDHGWPLNDRAFYLGIRKLLLEKGRSAWEPQAPSPAPAALISPPQKQSDEKKGIKDYLAYLRVPKLIRALGAKEMCSCLFVLERDFDTCKKDLKMQLPIHPIYFVNERSKTVRTSFLIEGVSRAQYRGVRIGCAIE
jgi:CubicO group peptidase (beta-lactamase class C family)